MDTQTPHKAAELLTSTPGAVVVAILNLDDAAKLLGLAMGYAGAPLVLKRQGANAVNSTSTPKKQKWMHKWDRKILDVLQSKTCAPAYSSKIAQLLGAPRGAISAALTDLSYRKLVERVKINGLYIYKAAASPDCPALEVSKTGPEEAAPTIQHRLLAFLKANKGKGRYTSFDLAEKFKISPAYARKNMAWLFRAGYVSRIENEGGVFVYEFAEDLPLFRQNTMEGGQA